MPVYIEIKSKGFKSICKGNGEDFAQNFDCPFRQHTIIIIFTCWRKPISVGSRLGMGLAVSHGRITVNPVGPPGPVKLLSRLAQLLRGPRRLVPSSKILSTLPR